MKKFKRILALALAIATLTACGTQVSSPDSKNPEETTKAETAAKGAEISKPETSAEEKEENHYPVTITNFDFAGNEITTTYEKCPEKALVIYQGAIETMLALGLEDKVVASYGLDNAVKPEWADGLKNMNYDEKIFSPDRELVASLNPDFIFTWSSVFSEKKLGDVHNWTSGGTNTYLFTNTKPGNAKHTIENEWTDLRNIGKIFNVEDKAEALIEEMKVEIDKALKAAEGKEKQKVLVMSLGKEDYTNYNLSSLAGDMVERLGAEPAMMDSKKFSKEDLLANDPDKIFVVFTPRTGDQKEIGQQRVESITKDPALQSLSAVKSNNVYPILLSDVYTSSVRTLDGIKTLSSGIYPQLQ